MLFRSGSLLVRFAPEEVADLFIASRLSPGYDAVYGSLEASGAELRAVVQRAMPVV